MFHLRKAQVLLVAWVALHAFRICSAADVPSIQFELVTEQGFPLGGSQAWLELLAKLNQTSIRIRAADEGEREAIQNQGTEDKPSYHVVGVLTSRHRLRIPGREFGLS